MAVRVVFRSGTQWQSRFVKARYVPFRFGSSGKVSQRVLESGMECSGKAARGSQGTLS